MATLAAARPDVLILASHIPDGVAFRQAMLAAGLHVGAFIGSTMAECDPDFAGALGPDAVGVFASDRPVGGFRPDALDPTARAVYDRFAAAWSRATAAADVRTNAGGDAALGWTSAEPGDRRSGDGSVRWNRRCRFSRRHAGDHHLGTSIHPAVERPDRGGHLGLHRRLGPVPRRHAPGDGR